MGIEAQNSALPTLFHFARVVAALQPHVFTNLEFDDDGAEFDLQPNDVGHNPRSFVYSSFEHVSSVLMLI